MFQHIQSESDLLLLVDQHFLGEGREEMVRIIETYSVAPILFSGIQALQDWHQAYQGDPRAIPLPSIKKLAMRWLHEINEKVVIQLAGEEKLRVKQAIAKLVRLIMLEISLEDEGFYHIFHSAFVSGLDGATYLHGYDKDDVYQLLQIEAMKQLVPGKLDTIAEDQEHQESTAQSLYLSWQWTPDQLAKLANLLAHADYNLIKSVSEFSNAFGKPGSQVRCNRDKKEHLIRLFYILWKEEKAIKLVKADRKGSFWQAVEMMLVDANRQPFLKNVRTMSSRINAAQDSKQHIFNDIGAILARVRSR